VPDQVAAPSVQRQAGRAGGALVISWVTPTNRGSAISTYTVTMKTAGGQSRTVTAAATSMVWDNLTNGTDYSFTLQATNNSGTSAESEIGTGRPSAPPDAPPVTATDGNAPNGGTLLAQWHPPANNGEAITTYLLNVSTSKDSITIDGSADFLVSADSAPDGNFSHIFTGLTNGVSYYVAVRAVNVAGNSEVGQSGAAMPYGAPAVTVAPTAVPGDGVATVSMGATDAPAGATIDSWIVNGTDSAGQTVSKVATAAADRGFSVVVPLVGPNVWGRTWQFVAVPRVRSQQTGQIKDGGQSPASDAVQPKGPPGNPDVQVVTQQGVSPGGVNPTVTLRFAITPGDGNGNPQTSMTFTYSSPWGDGGANGANQFELTIPMTATGTVTVRQTAADGSYSTGTVVVQQTVSVDTAKAIMTVNYSPEKPLFCEALSGTTVLDPRNAIEVAQAGSPTYYTYEYSYAAVPVGTGRITLQCGGDSAAPTYQISTTR